MATTKRGVLKTPKKKSSRVSFNNGPAQRPVHERLAHYDALAQLGNVAVGGARANHYIELKAITTKHQRKGGVCEPDHLGRPRTRSMTSKRCVLADSKTMRSQGQCVPRVRTLKSGRQVLIHRIPNPDYGKSYKTAKGKVVGQPFCIKSGGAKAKKIALRSDKPDLACAPHLKAVEGAHRVPVWTGKYNSNGKKVFTTTFKESIRCVKREGQQKQCPVGQALYQVKKTAKVFAKGSGAVNKKTGIKAPLKYTTKPVTKFICSKAKPAGAIGNAKPGTLPPKLHIAAKKVVDQDTLGRPVYRTHHPKHPVESNWGVQKRGAAKNHAHRRTPEHKRHMETLRQANRDDKKHHKETVAYLTKANRDDKKHHKETVAYLTKANRANAAAAKKAATAAAAAARKAAAVAQKIVKTSAAKTSTAKKTSAKKGKKPLTPAIRTSGRITSKPNRLGF